ncbi:DNA polymerase V [Rhizobium sp. BK049]|uniref:LexA family protein n=1 Tax=Rhizobium sp. BK049 TaxID=2587095 RepID=UPI00185194E7|nr:translesion error-prone DNA polymerase V autoproteolytic subunit [Rhizobium sp. BK049]MBB3356041.1 DNA polymerase V [Rhizobium sp. BK049]
MTMLREHGGRRRNAGRPRGMETKVVRLPVPVADLAKRLAHRGIRAGDVNAFLDVEAGLPRTVPLVGATAACGFPSPADDYLDRPLDFNELIIENPAATFAVRVAGDSMILAGIYAGDIAVVNRARDAVPGCIVLALVDGEFTIKRYQVHKGGVILHPENPAYPDIVIGAGCEFEVWGVITRSIRMF